jgi:hypothetical protein
MDLQWEVVDKKDIQRVEVKKVVETEECDDKDVVTH